MSAISQMPKVSIIIPVYGVEKYIERCVRSLFGQTLDSIEYIFVDDCSSDNSIRVMQKVLEEYPQRKDQVKIIRHEVNQGVGAARNHGVATCRGNYIIHCDSDDWVDLNFYESMYKKAIDTNADVVCAPFITEFADNCRAACKTFPKPADDVESYIEKNIKLHINSLCSKLYKKEIALHTSVNCPDHIFMGEDLLRNIQMLDKCQKIAFVNDSYYHYWQNAASITHSFTEKHFLNLKKIIDILSDIDIAKKSNIFLQIKSNMFLGALLHMHRTSALLPLFDEMWQRTTFKEKIKIIQVSRGSIKGKFALISACISKPLTIFIIRRILK